MKKPLLLGIALTIALGPAAVRAGPVIDLGLQFLGISTTIVGNGSNNIVNFQAAPGTVSGHFSGDAHSAAGVPAIVVGWGQYQSNALAASVAWDARFRVNQPGLRFKIFMNFDDYGAAVTDGYAFASGQSYVDLRLNGVSQLIDNQRASCNTVLLDCENGSPNQGSTTIFLDYLVVGQIIDIAGLLTTDTHATAGPICGSPTSITSCVGFGLASSYASFSVRVIPEPSTFTLLGLAGLAATRRRKQ